MKKFLKMLLNILYPPSCPFCNKIITASENACDDCKKLFPRSYFKQKTKNGDDCVSAFSYSSIFKKSVKNLKFHNRQSYAEQLGNLLVQSIKEEYKNIKIDYITAVPLSKKTLKERGYNQSALIAKTVSAALKIPYTEALEKYKENKKQHTLNKKERAENVKNVYRVLKNASISDKTILLIDDIITTGNTLGECAKVLKSSGAKNVFCASVSYA